MENKYPIYFQGDTIGTAEITKEGLYWMICCRCKPPAEEKFIIKLSSDLAIIDLGLCVSYGAEIGLKKRVAMREVSQKDIRFILEKKENGQFFPLIFPFPYISKLPKCVLKQQNGQQCAYFTEASAKQDSGQNP